MDHQKAPDYKFDLHQVVLQPQHHLVKLQRVGFKAVRTVKKGKFVRRQMSMDTGLLSIIGAKCSSSSFSGDLLSTQSIMTAPAPFYPSLQPIKPPSTALMRSKTSLSVVTFPSSSQTNQLRRVLGDRSLGQFSPEKKAELTLKKDTEARTPGTAPTVGKLVEEPPLLLQPLLRPAHVHTVEVKFRPSRTGQQSRGKDQISAILTAIRAKSAEKPRMTVSQKPLD